MPQALPATAVLCRPEVCGSSDFGAIFPNVDLRTVRANRVRRCVSRNTDAE